jgi:hypothetical protein
MQVSVRGSFGEWQTHRLRPRDWTNSWLRRGGSLLTCVHQWLVGLNWPGRIALGSGFLAALVAAVFALSDSAAAPPPPPKLLPTELAARASLFTEAWLDRDMPTMLKLTDKSFDRQLRQWSSKTSPPSATDRSQRKVEAMVSHHEAHRATITVHISPAGQAISSNRITQQQQWTDKDGMWYFVPSVAPKTAAPTAAASRRIR